MALLDDVKLILRLENDKFDSEVEMLIQSAIAFIGKAGVPPEKLVETNLSKRAKHLINIYAKTFFGYDTRDNQRKLPEFFYPLLNQLKLTQEIEGD